MQSKAKTVAEHLDSLPADRRADFETVLATVRKNLDRDYAEGIQYGMVSWFVPHSRFPDGYHCDPKQPLNVASLALQKHGFSLYVMGLYVDGELTKWFTQEWKKSGKKLDMGKACIRFKRADDLPLDVIGAMFGKLTVDRYLGTYTSVLATSRGGKAAKQDAKKASGATKPKAAEAKPARAKSAAKQPAAKKGKATSVRRTRAK